MHWEIMSSYASYAKAGMAAQDANEVCCNKPVISYPAIRVIDVSTFDPLDAILRIVPVAVIADVPCDIVVLGHGSDVVVIPAVGSQSDAPHDSQAYEEDSMEGGKHGLSGEDQDEVMGSESVDRKD